MQRSSCRGEQLVHQLVAENKELRDENKRLCSLLQFQAGFGAKGIEFEQVVQTAENLLSEVLMKFPFAVLCSDKELRYVYARCYNNAPPEYEELRGMTDEEMLKTLPEACHLLQVKLCVLRTGASQRREVRLEKPQGIFFLVLVCVPVFEKESIQGLVIALIDFTSQVSMEDNLAEMKLQVLDSVKVEEELRRSLALADKALEARNSFLAVMSHEIRTPLNGVLGMAQVLATTKLDHEQKELVDAMVFSGEVLLAIISDILDLSKIESGTMKLEEREFNPRDIVNYVVRTATAATKNRAIDIGATFADDVPTTVIGDPLRLKQVITNLVFNAVKFTKQGHVRVQVSTDLKARGSNNWVVSECSSSNFKPASSEPAIAASANENELGLCLLRFTVDDTGIGIPEEAFPLLFEKFSQVHSSTTRKYGGTGLGLAICKQLVELMGGTISVSSEVGKGSTFAFTLRCKCSGPSQGTRILSQTALNTNLCHTTAHIQKLRAGLPPAEPGHSRASSCPLSESKTMKVGFGSDRLPKSAETSPCHTAPSRISRPARLRRTSSGPPRIECSLMADVEDIKMECIRDDAASSKRRPKLLLVEDNKVNVMVALSMLKRLGHTAEVAYNGQEALNAIQNNRYDLVLMDVCMPVLDGLEVTKRVRMFERTGNWEESNGSSKSLSIPEKRAVAFAGVGTDTRLPIVALTANAFSDFEELCLKYGMDGFITKPVTFKKMKDALEQFLGNRLKTVRERSEL